MTLSAPASNNKSVNFRGRVENEMPPYPKPVSKAQNAAMHAAAAGKSTIGIPKKVGKEFAKGAAGKSMKKLPQRVDAGRAKRAIKRGAISDTAAKKHLGDY